LKTIRNNRFKTFWKKGVLTFFLLSASCMTKVYAQSYSGQVLCIDKKTPVSYANVSIIGKSIGTVSDENGIFILSLDNSFDQDSIKISIIGYKPETIGVKDLKSNQGCKIFLNPANYGIPEVQIKGSKKRLIRIGEPVFLTDYYAGFMYAELNHYAIGLEKGVVFDVSKKMLISTINLNVNSCSYDTMKLRLNVYKVNHDNSTQSLLTKPLYVSFLKEEVKEAVVFEVSDNSIIVEGKILISIEAYKYLGEGELIINLGSISSGYSYSRRTPEEKWRKSERRLGLYFYGQVVK
jgi:hypothetical protein